MNKERIAYVIELLSGIRDSAWNYGTWAEDFDTEDGKALPICGTVACAAGWMGMDPKIRAEGFYITANGSPAFEDDRQTCAIAAYLGISYVDATDIFINLHDAMGYDDDGDPCTPDAVTPGMVASALQSLLNRG